ncbi:hypothetical protein ES319_D02G077200v1 [Gossypium barbadense]|uniref:Uncharacterized protein n=2 Tax=Gossypium TaxID=3633 RepID=A0A5J5S9R9_GOSBA|nr:hypothetical protein ES319_D02G077200v1 [Gossypium barbadense]PPD92621.1 hypothetical protein GOBAR_DD10439 [Gossypium barbadense]TYG78719.1 hypothetical protein ES288_D02G082600v1 [Gossypium darwinii]
MVMEDRDEEEEHLNLSLAIVTDPNGENSRKRKRKLLNVCNPLNPSHEGYFEGKIFKLLQVREEMLKLDHKRSKGLAENGKGLHLIHSLLIIATSVDKNNMNSALENLIQLYPTVTLMGDSVQRVVAHFADGLFARILTPKSPFYDMVMKEPTTEQQFLAFTSLYRVSPYYQFAHFTANQAIIEAFEKDQETNNNRALHVIDFNVSYGFQWPSLIQSVSQSGKRVSLRLTGYGRSLEELQETEARLVSFAKGFCNLVFEFQGLLRSSSKLIINQREKKNETVAVNLVFHLSNFMEMSQTLKSVHSLKPSIVILVEQEGNPRVRNFLSRFMESLHYFAAMFDSLDDCLPQESTERLSIERNHLGKEIKAMINSENLDEENKGTWKNMMERHGFGGMKLSSKCLIQAKLLLKVRTHNYCPLPCEGENTNGGFRVFQRDEGKALSLGWQDRCLLTASAWQCV